MARKRRSKPHGQRPRLSSSPPPSKDDDDASPSSKDLPPASPPLAAAAAPAPTAPAPAAAAATSTSVASPSTRVYQLNDYLKNEANVPVLKQFIVFFIAMLILPLVAFFSTQRVARTLRGGEGAIAGLVASAATVTSLIVLYAVRAYREECRDYKAENKSD